MQNVKRHNYIMRDFAHYFKDKKVKKTKRKITVLHKVVVINMLETTYGGAHG